MTDMNRLASGLLVQNLRDAGYTVSADIEADAYLTSCPACGTPLRIIASTYGLECDADCGPALVQRALNGRSRKHGRPCLQSDPTPPIDAQPDPSERISDAPSQPHEKSNAKSPLKEPMKPSTSSLAPTPSPWDTAEREELELEAILADPNAKIASIEGLLPAPTEALTEREQTIDEFLAHVVGKRLGNEDTRAIIASWRWVAWKVGLPFPRQAGRALDGLCQKRRWQCVGTLDPLPGMAKGTRLYIPFGLTYDEGSGTVAEFALLLTAPAQMLQRDLSAERTAVQGADEVVQKAGMDGADVVGEASVDTVGIVASRDGAGAEWGGSGVHDASVTRGTAAP